MNNNELLVALIAVPVGILAIIYGLISLFGIYNGIKYSLAILAVLFLYVFIMTAIKILK